MDKTIMIDITSSGLGNQLHQIFTGISYSLENGHKFIIPHNKGNYTKGGKLCYWDSIFKNVSKNTIDYQDFMKKTKNEKFKIFNQKTFLYEEIPITEKIYIFGYFQQYIYYDKHKQQIMNLLGLNELAKNIKNKYKYNYDECISLHFRLGDYKNNIHHPVITNEYFIDSLKEINKKDKKMKYVLYFYQEEDKNIVKKSVETLRNLFSNYTFIEIDHNITDWEQMIIMSSCNHHIIANSSFSWWASYLFNNDKKIVTFPCITSKYYDNSEIKWFSSGLNQQIMDTFFPKNYIKINVVM